MLQSIKRQVQAQMNEIVQAECVEGVDTSGRTVRSYEQCKPILQNILDCLEYSGQLSDVEICRRICQSVGVEFDDGLIGRPDKCIEMVASAVVNYVNHKVDELNPVTRESGVDKSNEISDLREKINVWLAQQSDTANSNEVALRLLQCIDDKNAELDLSNLSLSSIPDFLDEFRWVKTLNLSRNKLTTFPDCLCRLTQIESVNLSENGFNSIPDEVTNLKKLKLLELNNNVINEFPVSLENQVVKKQLLINGGGSKVRTLFSTWDNKRITFYNNELNSWIEKGKVFDVSTCKMAISMAINLRLNKVDLSGLGLKEVPPFLQDMVFLKKVNLSRNPLGKFPEEVLGLRSLKKLSLSQCQLSSIPDDISLLEKLEEMDLGANNITFFPESISGLECLEVLNVEGNPLVSLPKSLGRMRQLRRLCYDFNSRVNNDIFFEVPARVDVVNTCYEDTEASSLSLEARRALLLNARGFMISAKNSRAFVMGNEFPTPVSESADFISKVFGRHFVLLEESDRSVENYLQLLDRLDDEQGNVHQRREKFLKCSTFESIEDFEIPTLNQFIHLSEMVNESLSKGENILVCCGYGGGRTGTMLAFIKVLYNFFELREEEKKEIPDMSRTNNVWNYNGTFSDLDDSHRTTDFVGAVVTSLRKSEQFYQDGAVSVETPDQFLTLELWHLLLSINHMVKAGNDISDEQIKKWIVDAGFSDDFLERFGKNNETGKDRKALSGLDYIVRTAKSLNL